MRIPNWLPGLSAALLLALAPADLRAQSDEETTFVRTGDPDEESTVLRTGGDEDVESTIVRNGGEDDEETTLVGAGPQTVVAQETVPEEEEGRTTARMNGSLQEKWAFDTAHDGSGEDVFDIRTRLSLSAEVVSPDFAKLFIAGRFGHYVVGEDAGSDAWYLFNSNGLKWGYEAELREAYLYLPNRFANLRVGNQVVRWGFGEVNKPSDVLNPTDFREGLFSDLEVPLIPVFMVHLDRSFGPVNVSGVWLPFFNPNRANLFGHDWAPMSAMYGNPAFTAVGGGMSEMYGMVGSLVSPLLEDQVQPLLLATQPPEETPANGQWGGKVEASLGVVDLAVSYLYGWDKLPWVHVDGQFLADVGILGKLRRDHPEAFGVMAGMTGLDPFNPAAGGIEMITALNGLSDDDKQALKDGMAAAGRILFDSEGEPRQLTLDGIFSTSYRRQQTVGLTASTVLFDRVGLKLDSAFSPERTLFLESTAGFPTPAAKPVLSYSVGADYRRGSWFDILAEFYHFHVFDLAPGEEVFILGSDMYMVTVASHLRFLDFDALEFQLAATCEVAMRNLFLFPKVSYKFTDGVKLSAGAILAEVLPGGDELGPAGLFDRNDSVNLDFLWSF